MIKRPLCVVGTIFVLFTVLFILVKQDPVSESLAADGDDITIAGILYKKELKEYQTILYIKQAYLISSSNISPGNDKKNNQVSILVYLKKSGDKNTDFDKYEEKLNIGAYLKIKGRFYKFSVSTNKGQFNEQNYYGSMEMDGVLHNAEILAESKSYQPYMEGLSDINRYLGNQLDKLFEKKDASVLKAMLLGDKTQLDKEIKNLYKINGIAHILAISGLHITIIGMGIYKMLRKSSFSYLWAFLFTTFIMLHYGMITGLSIATVRALGMFIIYLFSKVLGRTYDLLTSLAFMAIVMLLVNPSYLINAGFLLSFTAILAITIFYPVLSCIFPFPSKLWQSFLLSISVSVYTLPIIAYFYYEIPVYSVFLNVIVLPLMSVLLYTALLALLVSFLHLGMGKLLALPAHMVLLLYEKLCQFIEKLPHNRWIVGQPSFITITMYYFILTGFGIAVYYMQKRGSKEKEAKSR